MAVVWFSRTFDHEQRIGCELPASNCAEITGSLHVKFFVARQVPDIIMAGLQLDGSLPVS